MSHWVQAIYFGAFVYVLAGILVVYTVSNHREAMMDLVAKASRIIPGFAEGVGRGATRFGFGPEASALRRMYAVLAWPPLVVAVLAVIGIVRRFEKYETALRSEEGAPLLPDSGIFGSPLISAGMATESMRLEMIAERCGQVEEVFGPGKTPDEIQMLWTFEHTAARVLCLGDVPHVRTDGLYSVRLELSGNNLDAAALEMRRNSPVMQVELHREVRVDSGEYFDVTPYIAAHMLLPVGIDGVTSVGGSMRVRFYQDEEGWDNVISLDTLEGSPDRDVVLAAFNALAVALNVLNEADA